jgi:hypothetical protein
MITSFIIHDLGWQAGNKFGWFTPDSDYPLIGLLPEMRPVAFLDPSAFVGTNPTGRLITSGLSVIRLSVEWSIARSHCGVAISRGVRSYTSRAV